MKSVFNQILYEMEHKVDTMLVTIVADQGSAPRTSGARMLVGRGGRLLGTIGGGAVEKRSEDMALRALADKQSFTHDFILRSNQTEDLGMVCGGDVSVLFNRIPWDSVEWRAVAEKCLELLAAYKKFWFISPVEGGVPSVIAEGALASGENVPKEVYDSLEGETPHLIDKKYFAEYINCGERLIIFGAGHISRCLAPIARTVGFLPVIYDDRIEYADEKFFPDAEKVICASFERINNNISINKNDYVVVMTSGHKNDYNVQSSVMLGGEYAYLGVIGSRMKTMTLNKKLLEIGISQQALDGVHTPIGTNIKAVTPEEIAVSIAGELILVRAERRGGK